MHVQNDSKSLSMLLLLFSTVNKNNSNTTLFGFLEMFLSDLGLLLFVCLFINVFAFFPLFLSAKGGLAIPAENKKAYFQYTKFLHAVKYKPTQTQTSHKSQLIPFQETAARLTHA